jgi:hypothetical protein
MKNALFIGNGEMHVSYGRIQFVLETGVLEIVSVCELSYHLKGILPTPHGFQELGTSPLCKVAQYK